MKYSITTGDWTRIVDTQKAKQTWYNSNTMMGLYLSSKNNYYIANSTGARLVSQPFAAAWLIRNEDVLAEVSWPENLKQLAKEIVE